MESNNIVQIVSNQGTAKKLKQTLLPFQILSTTTKDSKKILINEPRKRKPSPINETEDRVAKVVRISDGKENLIEDIVVDSSSDDEVEVVKQNDTGSVIASTQQTQNGNKKNLITPKKQMENIETDKEEQKLVIKLPFPKKSSRNKSESTPKEDKAAVKSDPPTEIELEKEDMAVDELFDLSCDDVSNGSATLDNVELIVDKSTSEQLTKVAELIVNNSKGKNLPETAKETQKKSQKDSSSSSEINELAERITLITDEESSSGSNDISRAEECCTPDSSFVEVDGSDALRKSATKILKRKMDSELRNKQRQLAKEERERKMQEEKELKQKERDEKEKQRKKEKEEREELKRKEREEKEELRRKDKEERERKRLAEIELKNEEKKRKEELKEEERRKKEEERRKKDQEKEELENKHKKAAEAFTKFFVQKKAESKLSEDENSLETVVNAAQKQNFMPFCVKGDMRLAPIVRRELAEVDKNILISYVEGNNSECYESYLKKIKKINLVNRSAKTWPNSECNDEICIIDDDVAVGQEIEENKNKKQKFPAKYLKFHENQRPAYYGTWRKKSATIKPRKPFSQDKIFDYEVDSDDEWEEEEPGESLHGSDDDRDKESEDDYEVDNEFFVPHGHLSDEELQQEDEVLEDNSPDTLKAKLKLLQMEFAAEMKKKTEKIKPRLFGCTWDDGSDKQLGCSPVIFELFQARAMLFDQPIVFACKEVNPTDAAAIHSSPKTDAEKTAKRIKMTDDGITDLIKLIHGNPLNKKFLSKEYNAFREKKYGTNEGFREFLNISVLTKINELATWKQYPQEGPMYNKLCWCVPEATLKEYGLENTPVPNEWSYTLEIKSKRNTDIKNLNNSSTSIPTTAIEVNVSEINEDLTELKINAKNSEVKQEVCEVDKNTKSNNTSITDFVKKLSIDEKKSQFEKIKISDKSSSKPSQNTPNNLNSSSPKLAVKRKPEKDETAVPKKRVQLLMSVPRGEAIPQNKKNMLINQFLKDSSTVSTAPKLPPNPINNTKLIIADEIINID